ncbi:hypothetical protein NL676_009325 [Syzygium grande]|nr:hypothetical protein NL676_009325 [Syzygium grande]
MGALVAFWVRGPHSTQRGDPPPQLSAGASLPPPRRGGPQRICEGGPNPQKGLTRKSQAPLSPTSHRRRDHAAAATAAAASPRCSSPSPAPAGELMEFSASMQSVFSTAEVTGAGYSKIGDHKESIMSDDGPLANELHLLKLGRWQWWILVVCNIFFLIAGQAAAVLLGRFYYDQGGKSKWLATLVQTAGFPILFIPLYLIPSSQEASVSPSAPSFRILASVYFFLGVLIAGDNMLYSTGLLYLTASTYSLICASQLAFNAVFSYYLNSQKFTALILNSVVVLTLSTALIAVNDDSEGPAGVSKGKYILGFLCALGASALYSLFAFPHATLFPEAVCWQVCSVGVVGLIFIVSSLFSNVISTVGLVVTPIASVMVFHDKMNGVKVVAMLLALWGFASYIYQNYLDDSKARRMLCDVDETRNDSVC